MARRKSVTLKDIAERLDISATAVSTVLNNRNNGVWVSEATRQSIMEMAQQLGYQPKARPQAHTKTGAHAGNVAILCLPWYDPLFGKTVAELCRTLGEWGFHPFIHVAPDKVTSCEAGMRLHRRGRADAFIMLGSRYHANEVAIGDVPCVVIGEISPNARLWQVCVNNRHGGQLVGEYLWQQGHRRVGVVAIEGALYCEKEVAGLRSVWEERGAPFAESWILNLPETDLGCLEQALTRFLRRVEEREGQPLTALFCAGDTLAVSALRALKENGWRIPEDISVVGFDDSPLMAEFLDPPLTTVRQPFVHLGHVAAQLLRERILRPAAEPQSILLPGELVVRRSCAPPIKEVKHPHEISDRF